MQSSQDIIEISTIYTARSKNETTILQDHAATRAEQNRTQVQQYHYKRQDNVQGKWQ